MEPLQDWCERAASYFTQYGGMPPIAARAVAWLMVCDPPEQSAADIAAAIGASRASLTSTMRLLHASGLVQPVNRRGDRTAYHRIAEDGWATALRHRFAGLTALVAVTRDGLDLLGPDSPRAGRVRAAHDLYAWFADEVEPMWERRP